MLSAWLWSLVPTFVFAVPTTTVYLHRTVTHRALRLHPLVEWWFKFVNWISTGVDPAVWAAVHRKHHAYSDVELGPAKRDPTAPGWKASGTSSSVMSGTISPSSVNTRKR